MLSILMDNIATIIIGIALLLIVVFIIRKMIRDKKSGNCCGCSGCSSCHKVEKCHKDTK